MTTGTHAVIFCHCFSTFIFSSSYSSSFPIIFFRRLQQQAGRERKEPDGRDGICVGGDSNVGRHGGTEGTDGANGYIFFYICFCTFYSPLLFLSFFFFSDYFFFNGVQQQAGRMGPMATRDGTGEQADITGTSPVAVFFLLSSFLLLTFTISFVANYSNRRGGAEWDGTGRDDAGGDSNAGRDGGQAGGRRK